MQSLTLVVDDPEALSLLIDEHLAKGRAFVAGDHDVAERAPCELVVTHRGRSQTLVTEVVHVRREDPGRGVGLQLPKPGPEVLAALHALADAPPEDAAAPVDEGAETEEGASEGAGSTSLHDRIRSMTGAEQLRLAASGSLVERTLLERMYGPTVWEPLLRNARITIPEVARIARKATLPRPLVELVANNAPWLASSEIQRALLSNSRSSPTVIQKVLSAMSRRDLQLVPQQTAYPEPVRAAAKKRLGR